MTLPIVFAPEAKIDLEEAADYYELQQSGLGESFLRAVDDGLARIRRFPQRRTSRQAPARSPSRHRPRK